MRTDTGVALAGRTLLRRFVSRRHDIAVVYYAGHGIDDVEHRSNPVFKREYLDATVHEIVEGVVYEAGGVKVTAFPVEHDDGNPAFGYRIDAAGRSVLLTGDTTYNENVVKYGMNDEPDRG